MSELSDIVTDRLEIPVGVVMTAQYNKKQKAKRRKEKVSRKNDKAREAKAKSASRKG